MQNGHLYGYRKPPAANDSQQEEPLNKFQVIDCSVIRQDKIKQNAFVIHFNQMKIERLFAASSQQDRYGTLLFTYECLQDVVFLSSEEWISAIEKINQQTTPHLQHQLQTPKQFHNQMVTNDISDHVEDARLLMNEVFTRRPVC